jgi:hypothetical protein
MTVKAWLEGDRSDLQALTRLLVEVDARVVHDANEDAYYLTAPEIDSPSEPRRFDRAAEPLLRRINGMARVQNADYQPVKLSGKYTDHNGQNIHFAEAALEIRLGISMDAVAIGPDGKPKPQPDPPFPWPQRLALAETHSDVREALEIMGKTEPLGWDNLYKVHEIVRDSIKPQKIPDLGWADKATDSAFTVSANLPGVRRVKREARPDGRHPESHDDDQAGPRIYQRPGHQVAGFTGLKLDIERDEIGQLAHHDRPGI